MFSKINQIIRPVRKPLFIILSVLCCFSFMKPALALFLGILFALLTEHPYPKFAKKTSKYLLQLSVIGLGFGMNLQESLQSGKEGMLFTIISVTSVLLIGFWLGNKMQVNRKTSYLIASGTAICGGSAIAAVAPIVKADDNQISVALGTVFVLNAIALFIFPPLGRLIGMTQEQFGMWAAIAIHDTSSVVGAGAAYGQKALEVATMIKLTRALWIIPLAFVTMLIFKDSTGKVSIPWFIFIFVLAMVINTYVDLPMGLSSTIVNLAHVGLTLTLFFIGSGLSYKVIKVVGFRPMIHGVTLWLFIGVMSLLVVLYL